MSYPICKLAFLVLASALSLFPVPFAPVSADWESWWTYEGISGPDFWGRLNPKWSHCSKGHRQSPIDISTRHILYDPNLEPVAISGDKVRGQLLNTGRGISLLLQPDKSVVFSGGPLSYPYTLSNITLHFGRENNRGSEHTIDGMQFSGELQLYAYNSQLYANWSEAKREPNGLAAFSVFIVLSKNAAQANAALKQLTSSLKNITRRGQTFTIEALSIVELLPTLRQYVTYEGSLTQPACHETVQWVVLNKPIYINSYQFHMLRHSLKGDGHQDNFRPTQQLNKRPLRSNIVGAVGGGSGSNNINTASVMVADETTSGETNQKNIYMSEGQTADGTLVEETYQLRDVVTPPALSLVDEANSDGAQQFSGAIRDDHRCLGEQIRLYGYKANRKINEEL